jgi:hypothetical protein
MTNDDANDTKYREWWEKLKTELATDEVSEYAVSPRVTLSLVIRRMLRIENEAQK